MKEFFKKVGEGIKEKAKDLGKTIKAILMGIKGISKEEYEALVEQIKSDAEEVGTKADTDSDGGITTKDMKSGIEKKQAE